MKSVVSSIAGFLRALGAPVSGALIGLGQITRFLFALLASSGTCLRRPGLVVREMYFVGVLSLIIILVSSLFVGMVLGLQMYETLQRFGSGDVVGMVVALALVRELGPVLAALLIASRAGSALTAEIGLMKTTEQLSAMEMMAIQPHQPSPVNMNAVSTKSMPRMTSADLTTVWVVAIATPAAVGAAWYPWYTAISMIAAPKKKLLMIPLTTSMRKSTAFCICDQKVPASTPRPSTATR